MKIHEIKTEQFEWFDVVEPNSKELKNLFNQFGINFKLLANTTDTDQLPMSLSVDGVDFLFLRLIDPKKQANSINIQELTTKLTLVVKGQTIITIHRLDLDFLKEWRKSILQQQPLNDFIQNIIWATLQTYDQPLNELENRAENFEESIFHGMRSKQIIREGYILKRKATAFRKCLKLTVDIMNSLDKKFHLVGNDIVEIRDLSQRLLFYTEDVLDNVTGLLSLHISLSSQKTNEVMRILTVFSIFFLPLNFLAGIYGMNFESMPELKWKYGYPFIISIMLTISMTIFGWVYRKGWLSRPED